MLRRQYKQWLYENVKWTGLKGPAGHSFSPEQLQYPVADFFSIKNTACGIQHVPSKYALLSAITLNDLISTTSYSLNSALWTELQREIISC